MSTAAELAGRVVLVTGASRGLGRAVGAACAASGATVLACGRDVPALEAFADAVEARGEPSPVLVPVNLEAAGADDFGTIAALVEERFGRLDGLVLNAAMLGELAPLATFEPVTWARVFQVNVHSTFLLLQALLPLLTRAPDGAVVFSLAPEGRPGRAHWGAYAASKGALHSLFEVLAEEQDGPGGVRVHAVMPEPIHTHLRLLAFPGADPDGWPAPETAAPAFVEALRGRVSHGGVVVPGRQS